MTKKELYSLLDMDSSADFSYFEQFADLVESEEEIPEELFIDVLSEISVENLGDIIENYFEDLSNHLPDESEEFFSLISNIEQRLLLLAADADKALTRNLLGVELSKFHDWYTNPIKVQVDGDSASVLDAVTSARETGLSGKEHKYDLSSALDYELEELSMDLGSFEKIDL